MIIHFIQSGVLVTLFFASIIALLSIPFYRLVRNKLTQIPCQTRSKILTLWLLSPLFIGLLLALSGILSSWMDSHEIATAHCSSHNNSIAHLCLFDPMVHVSDFIWMSGVGIMAILIIFNTYKVISLLVKHRRFQTTLHAIAEKQSQTDVFRIASQHFFVFSSGLLTPQAFISSNLIEQLSTQQLDVVLAHEHAHCQRRDVLRRLLLSFAGIFHFSTTRQQLLSDIELAHEQICDIAAVEKVGDRVFVAETIIQIARQLNTFTPEQEIGSIAFNGSHIDVRVRQLLDQPKAIRRSLLFFSTLFFSLVLSGILTLTTPIHHLL